MGAMGASPRAAPPPPGRHDGPDRAARPVGRSRPQDRAALGEVLVRKRAALVGYLCNHVDDEQTAEDLAHDVLTSALAHLDEMDTRRSVWPWLLTIARHRLIDHYRRCGAVQEASEDPRVAETLGPGGSHSEMGEFSDPAIRYQERELLELALGTLNRRQRSALVLHDAQDWTSDQLAELYDRDRNAVHQLLHRARTRTRDEYLRLAADRGPRALLPWPLVWAGELARRAVARTRELARAWQPTLPAVGDSTAGLAAAVTAVGAALLLTTGAPPPDAGTGDAASPERTVPAAVTGTQPLDDPRPLGASPALTSALVPSASASGAGGGGRAPYPSGAAGTLLDVGGLAPPAGPADALDGFACRRTAATLCHASETVRMGLLATLAEDLADLPGQDAAQRLGDDTGPLGDDTGSLAETPPPAENDTEPAEGDTEPASDAQPPEDETADVDGVTPSVEDGPEGDADDEPPLPDGEEDVDGSALDGAGPDDTAPMEAQPLDDAEKPADDGCALDPLTGVTCAAPAG